MTSKYEDVFEANMRPPTSASPFMARGSFVPKKDITLKAGEPVILCVFRNAGETGPWFKLKATKERRWVSKLTLD